MAEGERLQNSLRFGAGLRINQFQLVAGALHELGAGLGADADPVEAPGAATVPLVSTAISKSCACSASISAAIHLQQRLAAGADHEALACSAVGGPRCLTAAARARQPRNFPPPGPLVPAKSVSQNWQIAEARSASRPDHRLQPAKRQKTAARPVCAPSPCNV